MWKKIRVLSLLIILLIVAVNTWRDHHQDWSKPIIVLLHPINADGQATTEKYIQNLQASEFSDAQEYLKDMSKQYRGQPISVYFQLGRTLHQVPPKVPEHASMLQSIMWSFKFRYYAWKQHTREDRSPSVTLFLNYYDPKITDHLKHSTALEKGRIGSINVFASKDQSQQNKIVVVHELLHAFGASDKYDYVTGQPKYPEGYAYPDQKPLYPQMKAELMAGHIALTESTNTMPDYLGQTVISQTTAQELGWLKK